MISHEIHLTFDRGHEARVVQLNLSVAFDQCWPPEEKLLSLKIGDSVLSVLTQLLQYRNQRVGLDGSYRN